MIRLAQPIMIGWVATLARHFVPKGAPPPFIPRPPVAQSVPYAAAYFAIVSSIALAERHLSIRDKVAA
jgi:hypothetical protein